MNEIELVDRRGRAIEHRDPRGATQTVGWTSPDLPQVEEWDATQAFRLGYAANVVAYRCVQLRAGTAASVPFVAGRRLGDTNTINERAELSRLLGPPPGGPAPKLSARKLMRWTHAQRIVTGRRAWEIETDKAGTIQAFWPLAAAHLRPVPSQSGNEWFRVFDYGKPQDRIQFKPNEIFYGWDPSGIDFRQAESPLQAARFDLTLVNLCDRYGIGFLRNNAVPAAIITTTAFPTEAARRSFMANWRAEFGGPDQAGRVALNEVGDDGDGPVSDSIHVEKLGLSAKDSQLTTMRKDVMNEIAMAIGVPWSKLDASGRTYSNADAEDRTWWEETILPDLFDLADDINMQLAPRLGGEVGWFDLRGVPALRRKHFAVLAGSDVVELVKLGGITLNEVRVDSELEPLDGLDVPLEIPAPQPVPPQLQQPPAPPALPPAPEPKALPPARTPPKRERRIADPAVVEARRANIWRNADASARTMEGRWERAWRKLFTRQAEATISRLTGKRGRQALEKREPSPAPSPQIDPASVFDVGFWTAAGAELASDLYEGTAAEALSALSLRFGIAFDVGSPTVADFIEARARQLAGFVTDTTYEAIRTAMLEGVTAGESIDDIATRIRHVFAVASDSRATTIARTEVISAYNGAAALGAAQLPGDVVAAQEWIATRDTRTRDAHAAADGQIVAIGQPFTVGGRELAYPGDPNGGAHNTVNCRCTAAFLTPEEFTAATERSKGRSVEMRVAAALLAMVPVRAEGFDFITWRRAVEEVAA